MQNSDDLVDLGEKHHQAGRLAEAESCYRNALEIDPGHPGALYFLAGITYDDGRLQITAELLEGLLRSEPNDAEAWHLLGMVALKEENFHRASQCFTKALAIQPAYAQAHYSLGDALSRQGQLSEALDSFQRAIALNPKFAEAHCAVGNIFKSQKNLDAALASYREAVSSKPGFELAYQSIGEILHLQGNAAEALAIYRQAIAENPASATLYVGLGVAYSASDRMTDATANFEHAITLDRSCVAAYSNLADALAKQGKVGETVQALRQAVALDPKNPRLLTNLSKLYRDAAQLTDAIDCARQALAADPSFSIAHNSYLSLSQYFPNYSREQCLVDHVNFGKRFTEAFGRSWHPYLRAIDAGKRPRVGFVSGDLCRHPVGFFLEGVLRELHKLDGLDIFVYSTTKMADSLTDRLRAATHAWAVVADLSDDELERRIRRDDVDILVDLSGHTAFNRLLVFARKPAPVQVTWLGYWETTGLSAIDYILCDRYGVHDDEARFFVEKPWFLPHTRLCFTPPIESIPVASLPALNAGYVTFGSFNDLVKTTDRVVAVWARVLKRVPHAKLLLKSKSLGEQSVRESIKARFAAHDISADRLLLEPASPHPDYLLAYNQVDIALDPFPFPGGTTSVQGLWMGVPMITMRGDRIISRQGEAILHNIGLEDWIVDNEDAYVELAARRSQELTNLAALRGQLRAKLEASPLCDARLFARNLESAFKQMWDTFRRNSRPADPDEFIDIVAGATVTHGLPTRSIDFSGRRSQPMVVIAAAPKSGSTFLSNVISRITKLPYSRLTSAYGTNEHDLFLPALLMMNNGGCVSQLHMKGTFHNAALLRAFAIKPIILVRNIEDTVVSLAEDLRAKEQENNFGSGQNGFSFLWQDQAIANLNHTALIDCVIDLALPWYVNFYVSWYRLCARQDVAAIWVTYEEMMADKRTAITNVLKFVDCGDDIHFDDAVLEQRFSKFNKGESGRGADILSAAQKARIRQIFTYYSDVDFSKYGVH